MQTADSRRRHARATSARRHRAERLWLVAVAALVIGGALSSVEGTYAMWREQAEVSGPTLDSGSAQLKAAWHTDQEASPWHALLPGESERQQVTVTNTGDAPMSLSALVPVAPPGLEIRAVGGETQQPLTTPVLHAEGQRIPAGLASGSALTLEPGRSAQMTVEVSATDALAPGDKVAFELVIDGEQTR